MRVSLGIDFGCRFFLFTSLNILCHSFSGLQFLLGKQLIICWEFTCGLYNVLSLSLIFVGLVTKCLGVLLLGFILPGTLLPGLDYFLSHVRKVSAIISSNIFSGPSSPPSETPMMWVLVHLMLSQRSLRLSSSFFFLFSISCSAAVVYTVLSSRSFICSPASFILLLIPSSVLFMFVCS